jgi:hypothetical protein
LKQLFEDLRYPVKTRGLGDLRGLPVVVVNAPLETFLPPDDFIFQITQLSGIAASPLTNSAPTPLFFLKAGWGRFNGNLDPDRFGGVWLVDRKLQDLGPLVAGFLWNGWPKTPE